MIREDGARTLEARAMANRTLVGALVHRQCQSRFTFGWTSEQPLSDTAPDCEADSTEGRIKFDLLPVDVPEFG